MDEPNQPGLLERLGQIHRAFESITGIISTGSAVVGFIRSTGGLVSFLVELGTFAFACYIAIFVVVPVVIGIQGVLERATNRSTTDAATLVFLGTAVLGGGALIRFGLFAPDITEDLDTIGTAFTALVGVALLCVPLVILWFRSGSTPNPH